MLGDCVMRFGVAEDFGARCGREVRLAVNLQHSQRSKLAVLEHLHLVHV